MSKAGVKFRVLLLPHWLPTSANEHSFPNYLFTVGREDRCIHIFLKDIYGK